LNIVEDSVIGIVLLFVDVLEMFDGCCNPFDVMRLPDVFCLQIQQPVSVAGMVVHIANEYTVLATIRKFAANFLGIVCDANLTKNA